MQRKGNPKGHIEIKRKNREEEEKEGIRGSYVNHLRQTEIEKWKKEKWKKEKHKINAC